ncbi:MAG: lytic transglycosylase domain-containing protein [Chitinispirillia bacterium]|jgi:hypothetical protein
MKSKRYPLHFRIIFRKNHLWISQLIGFLIVSSIVITLAIQGVKIFLLYIKIVENKKVAGKIPQEKLLLIHTRDELKEKVKISEIIEKFTRKRLTDEIRASLVDIVYTNSKTFGYDPLLIFAVINVESYFDPNAKGQYRSGKYSGAYGLMQLKVATAKEIADFLEIPFNGMDDLFRPEINIPLGIAYLTQMVSLFKSLKLGILAYNQGPGTIRKNLREKNELSINYYTKVLNNYFALKKIAE